MQISIPDQKKLLRARCQAMRAAVSNRATLDTALCREIAAHPAFLTCDTLLCYAPIKDEPNLIPLYRYALRRGITLAFPRCVDKQMYFHTVTGLSELSTGRFDIPEPPANAPLVKPNARTLCLLPALAATRDGRRLGYGGCFYDRFLAQFPIATLLPIYSALILPSLPQEPTDIPASHILTEKGVLLPHG